jgi:serine/threonine-protein kinase SBK
MLTGNFPWENADIGDVYFKEFVLWQRRKTTKLPSQWRRFTPRAMKLFRKALDIKPERRCEVKEVYKYLTDQWTQKARANNDSEEESGSSASVDHMDELTTMLQDHGIETKVDRRLRERRISEWLLSL